MRQQLYRIDSKAVNRRIREWLDADDKLAVARAPGNRKPELPDSSRFEQFAASALHPAQTATSQPNRREKKNKLSSAAKKTVRPDDGAMPLLPQNRPSADGSPFYAPIPDQVLNSRYDHPNKVAYYQPGNGDQAVILQHPGAGDRVYFQALSEGGYMQSTLNPMQAKLAAELLWQQMPDKWQQWSRLHGLGLNYRLDSHSQSVSGDVPYVQLGELLRLYRAYYIQPEFNERWKGHLQMPPSTCPSAGNPLPAAKMLRPHSSITAVPNIANPMHKPSPHSTATNFCGNGSVWGPSGPTTIWSAASSPNASSRCWNNTSPPSPAVLRPIRT